MPTISSLPARALFLLLISLFVDGLSSPGQTLARPNWAGSGMSTESWSKFAFFYRIDAASIPPDGLAGITKRLDDLQTLGVDALWIDPYRPDAGQPASSPDSLNPALGTMAEVDDLIGAASQRRLRVVIDLPASASPEAMRSIARFWLSHGAAGLYLKGSAESGSLLHDLRRTESSFAGERILIADASAIQPGRPDDADLRLKPLAASDAELSAAMLRSAMDSLQTATAPAARLLLSIDPANRGSGDEPLGQAIGAMLMSSGSAIAISAGQLPDAGSSKADSIIFYRQLSALRRDSPAFRSGDITRLSPGDPDVLNILVWLRRTAVRKGATPPIVVACNLTGLPLRLAVAPELARLKIRGRYMRTVLRSYPGFGPERADGLTLPAFGVYIGELHY